jgi:protein gp37
MAEKSSIQWTDGTHNIARGCTKIVDETPDGKKVSDCRYCYMYRDSMDGTRYKPNEVIKTKTVFDFPLKYKNQESAVWKGKPLIFTSSLTDVYHVDIDLFRDEYWDIARKSTNSIKQILTKRPERINEKTPLDFLDGEFTETVWMGTSCGSQFGESRIKSLCECNFKGIKFLSIEPLWSELILPNYCLDKIDWVIIGGESGFGNIPNDPKVKYGYRECNLDWMYKIVEQCKNANVPVFIKQMGTHLAKELKMSDRHGGNINEFPEKLQIRDFPFNN